jgi:HNH endonuclease
MQQIPLNQNKIVIVDDENYEYLSIFHWIYRPERDGKPGYAIRHAKEGTKTKTVYLHRDIIGDIPPGHEIIFKNHDRLDCRRENLAAVTKQEARRHHRARSDNKSGIRGVHQNRSGSWTAFTIRDGTYHALGAFCTRQEAIDAYQQALHNENPAFANAPATVERHAAPRGVDQEQTALNDTDCKA